MDGQITPVHLIQPLYKHLMGWPVTFKDLEHIDDQVGAHMCEACRMVFLASLLHAVRHVLQLRFIVEHNAHCTQYHCL
jgi:hypothetical protein